MSHRVASPVRLPLRVSDEATTAVSAVDGILDIRGTGARTVNLPDAGLCTGLLLIIKDGAGNALLNNITVSAQTSPQQYIDGVATQVLAIDGDCISIYSDGSNWKIWGALA